MKRFLIGQYGGFDEEKYAHDFRDNFYGIEACLFDDELSISRLIEEKNKKGFQVGVHYPFFNKHSKLRDASFLELDLEVRANAYQEIEAELEALIPLKPQYVLFHYPKPVILDDRVNWDRWKFADPAEYVYENQYSLEDFTEASSTLFPWLSKKSEQYGFTPILEFDAVNRYIYETDALEALLKAHPKVRLCLDTSRHFIQEQIDPHFSAERLFRRYTKYADLIHLSNAQATDAIKNRHFPVLPELDPKEGWAPIETYLKIIREENPSVRVLFEHQSTWITSEDLERCYQWVEKQLTL